MTSDEYKILIEQRLTSSMELVLTDIAFAFSSVIAEQAIKLAKMEPHELIALGEEVRHQIDTKSKESVTA